MTQISAGLSIVAKTRAARTIFSQVFPTLMMLIPDHRKRRIHVRNVGRMERERERERKKRQDELTIGSSLEDVGLHGLVAVLGPNVALGSKELLDVLLGGVEGGGKSGRSHDVSSGLKTQGPKKRKSPRSASLRSYD
jgi:hypothetical protein